jgi:hypothetical protein
MAFVTGEVVPNPSAEMPFKVVIKYGDQVIGEWPVASVEAGEAETVKALRNLAKEAKRAKAAAKAKAKERRKAQKRSAKTKAPR